MNIDYSQFYRGTTNIPSYGNGIYKKDTLVKYEFNTTDEHGNKIMDKMSREETLQAMKDIGSQYGDAVIVEFSGDGMAALVENKKGIVDANVTHRFIPGGCWPGGTIRLLISPRGLLPGWECRWRIGRAGACATTRARRPVLRPGAGRTCATCLRSRGPERWPDGTCCWSMTW